MLHVPSADEGPDTPLQSTLRLLMGELSRHPIVSDEAADERLIEAAAWLLAGREPPTLTRTATE